MQPTILLVDDDPEYRKLIGVYLRGGGFEVVEASSGKETLDYLENSSASLVLLDIVMPGIDGLEVLKFIKEKHSDLPVIAVTGLKDSKEAKQVIELGAKDYITKPVDFEYLHEAIAVNLI